MNVISIAKHKQKVFEELYLRGFGFQNTSHTPQHVMIQTDTNDKPCILYAGYEHDKATWYLQFSTRFVAGDDTHKLFGEWLIHMSNKYKAVMCAVENTNLPPLMRCLKSGFKIIGTRTTLNGVVLVEMIKELKGIQ